MPFLSTHFYTGALVERLGGTDISWIIGLVVPGLLYYVAARRKAAHVPERLILPDEPSLP
jgi:NCS1 family nucleobase:cation symporter-1